MALSKLQAAAAAVVDYYWNAPTSPAEKGVFNTKRIVVTALIALAAIAVVAGLVILWKAGQFTPDGWFANHIHLQLGHLNIDCQVWHLFAGVGAPLTTIGVGLAIYLCRKATNAANTPIKLLSDGLADPLEGLGSFLDSGSEDD